MNESVPSAPSAPAAPPPVSQPRPFYWSVRREIWENRSIYVAPLAAAAFGLIGSLISAMVLSHRMRTVWALDPGRQRAALERPFGFTAGLIIITAFIVGVFYCLDALHGERRDRSILFWKSLPVSDLTTVLAKASIPLVVLPVITFAIIVTTQLILLVLNTAILAGSGLDASAVWTQWPIFQKSLMLLYALLALALWHAPIYGWFLLVSGWAKRAVFLWALLPLILINIIEQIAFNTHLIYTWQTHRLFGAFTRGFIFPVQSSESTSQIRVDPGRFLRSPGLWIGLAFAAAFIAAAVRLRHDQEPI